MKLLTQITNFLISVRLYLGKFRPVDSIFEEDVEISFDYDQEVEFTNAVTVGNVFVLLVCFSFSCWSDKIECGLANTIKELKVI